MHLHTRRTLLAALVAAPILAAPQASANVGLPMIVVVWPIAWLAFVPVALLEGLLYRRALGISAAHGFRSACQATPGIDPLTTVKLTPSSGSFRSV